MTDTRFSFSVAGIRLSMLYSRSNIPPLNEEAAIMDVRPLYCPQCRMPTFSTTVRLVREACGHLKCRQCLLQEEHGCRQCAERRFLPHNQQQQQQQQLQNYPNNNQTAIQIKSEFPVHNNNNVNYQQQQQQHQPTENEYPDIGNGGSCSNGSGISKASGEKETVSETDIVEFRAKLNATLTWVNLCDFVTLDDELEWLSCQYMSRIHDVLANESGNSAVIERGKKVGLEYVKKIAQNLPQIESTTSDQQEQQQQQQQPVTSPITPKVKRKRNSIHHENYSHIVKNEELDPPEYLCTICKRQFKNRLNIRYHIACADKSAGHKCDECDRIFKSSSHLTYHKRTAHGGEKPYKCRFCEKAFAQSVKLKRHERTHTGERPFQCQVCKHSFTTKYNLKEHENIHKAEKPYICSFCGSSFADRNNLRRHESSHVKQQQQQQLHTDDREQNTIRCELCHRFCSDLRELRRHEHACHPDMETLHTPIESAVTNEVHALQSSCPSFNMSTPQMESNNAQYNNDIHWDSPPLSADIQTPPFGDPPLIANNNPSPLITSGGSFEAASTSPSAAGESEVRLSAFNQVKELLRQVKPDEIGKLIETLSSKERRGLIQILRAEADAKKKNKEQPQQQQQQPQQQQPMPVIISNSFDAFSDISTGSKKEFLRRYKRQILKESGSSCGSSSVGSIQFPTAANSITAFERQQLMNDLNVSEESGFVRQEIVEHKMNKDQSRQLINSFESIMQGIHKVIKEQETPSQSKFAPTNVNANPDNSGSGTVLVTNRGLRKVGFFIKDEDEEFM